jgi:hypothetical protein
LGELIAGKYSSDWQQKKAMIMLGRRERTSEETILVYGKEEIGGRPTSDLER